MNEPIELQLNSAQTVTLSASEGRIEAMASVKVRGGLYYLSFGIKGGDAGPTLAPFSSRIETFCGKPVRGKANVELEGLMDSLREATLQAVRAHPSLLSRISA